MRSMDLYKIGFPLYTIPDRVPPSPIASSSSEVAND